ELRTEVVGDHAVARLHVVEGGAVEVVAAFAPLVRLARADFLGQVHAVQSREGARGRQRLLDVDIRAGHDAAGQRTLVAQDAGQPARVDAGNGHGPATLQVLRQAFAAAPVAGDAWHVAYHQPGCLHLRRFAILGIDPGVADVRVGQGDDLPGVGRIGQDFLVTGHGRVEDDLANRLANRAHGMAAEHAAVCEGEQCRNRHTRYRLILDTTKSASRGVTGLCGSEKPAGRLPIISVGSRHVHRTWDKPQPALPVSVHDLRAKLAPAHDYLNIHAQYRPA